MPAATTSQRIPSLPRIGPVLAVLAALSACASRPAETGVSDPFEVRNRKVHEFNRQLDTALLKPAADVYGAIPEPIGDAIGNFASNLEMPGIILNNALQFDISNLMNNTIRFALNTTVGLGGILDVATAGGIYKAPTDFGATLAFHGVREGHYVELPVFGPSTQRDTVGLALDYAFDPLNSILTPRQRLYASGAKVLAKVGDRHNYSELVDSLLYGSEDSYAQARLLYLQTRRYQLQGGLSEDDYDDPYAE